LKELETAAAEAHHKETKPDSMRQAIAKAMSRSNAEIPHYYLSTPINMTPALTWLEAQNAKRSIKERILPAALVIRAIVKALKEVPELNGFWQDDTPQISQAIHPGIAISLRKGGLITPALIDAQDMDLDQTMAAFHDLVTRTRSGKLRSSEMTKQTISITNLGDLGVEQVYGIIYPPQVALVGLGRIVDAPWVRGDTLTIQKVMQATLAGDHRATDGRTGALFLNKLDQILQKPEEL
jgi:pyruvate dehydrogenase E2 component (dihydrolipoamide acetyltransferase)